MTTKNDKPAQKPVHTIRSGAIEVAIWMREGDKGRFYTATPRRSYKQGDQWKDTDSFGEDDLLRLGKMLHEADDWIVAQRRQQRVSKKSAA